MIGSARYGKSRSCLMATTGVFQLGGGIAAANRLAFWTLKDAGYQIDILALNETSPGQGHAAERYEIFSNNKVRFALAVWRALLTRHYSFVFCDHVNLAAVLYPLKILMRLPVIVRLNGIEVFPPFPSFEGRIGLHAATYLIAISDFTRDQVIKWHPNLSVTTIDLSLSPTAGNLTAPVPPDNDELMLEAVDGVKHKLSSRCILTVGRMASNERYKGQDILIQAMEAVVSIHPSAQLVLVGRGDDYQRLRQLALNQSVDVRTRIFMPGFVDDALLQRLYRQCYLFAMPSRGEGFGLVYLEAMRWSRACLGSQVDAAATIIIDGVTGRLVSDPTDVDQIASTTIDLMDRPEEVAQMGRQGFDRLTQYYLFEHFSKRFIDWVSQHINAPASKVDE